MGHVRVVGGSSNLELLLEFHQFNEHRLGFIGHISSEVCNGINDVIDGFFERLGWVDLCVSRYRGESVSGYSRNKIKSGRWVYTGRVWYSGPDI